MFYERENELLLPCLPGSDYKSESESLCISLNSLSLFLVGQTSRILLISFNLAASPALPSLFTIELTCLLVSEHIRLETSSFQKPNDFICLDRVNFYYLVSAFSLTCL